MPNNRNRRNRSNLERAIEERNEQIEAGTPTPPTWIAPVAPAPAPPTYFSNEIDGDYYYQQMEDRVMRQMERAIVVERTPQDESSPIRGVFTVSDNHNVIASGNNDVASYRDRLASFAAMYGGLPSAARQTLQEYAANDARYVRDSYGTWEVEPYNPPTDPFNSAELQESLRESRREQAARLHEQQQRRQAEERREREERARLEVERMDRQAQETAMAMRVTLTPEVHNELDQMVKDYYGTDWYVLGGAFKMDALYRHYIGSPPSDYVCVFAASHAGPVDAHNVRVLVYRRHSRTNAWQRAMDEPYRSLVGRNDIGQPLSRLFNHATLRGRSLNVTGGQLLMEYALNDRDTLAEIRRQYRPDEAEQTRRALRFNQIIANNQRDMYVVDATLPQTQRGQNAANASRRHPRRQPARAS